MFDLNNDAKISIFLNIAHKNLKNLKKISISLIFLIIFA